MKTGVASAVILTLLTVSAAVGADPLVSVKTDRPDWLTETEHQFLQSHQPLKLCVDPGWMPYERIDEAGKHTGIASDYIDLLRHRLNVRIDLYPTNTWQESLVAVSERRCDMLSMARDIPERRRYLDFTEPYISFPFVVATTNDKHYVDNFDLIRKRRFAATRGFAVVGMLRQIYPDIDLVEVDNIQTGLELVRQREVFGFIDSTLAITYAIQQQGLLDLKVSAQLEQMSDPSIATRNDQPLLKQIFEKALKTISDKERAEIYNRWVSIRYEQQFDYVLLAKGLGAFSALLLVSLYWNRRLSVSNRTARMALHELSLTKQALEQQNEVLEQQNRQLELFATTDALTGLHNRASLDQQLVRLTERSRCSGAPLGLMMLDIDHFKHVNDTWGHQIGDQTLIRVADLLKRIMSELHPVGRWGGEEFMMIWPEATVADMQQRAELIRRVVEQEEFHPVEGITVSIGIALLGEDCNINSMISRADCALYNAKERGRNRVEVLLQRFATTFEHSSH